MQIERIASTNKTVYSAEHFNQEVSTTNRLMFSWLRWVDPKDTVAAIDKFYETCDVCIFAPSLTNAIRKNFLRHLESLRKAMRVAITGDFHLVY